MGKKPHKGSENLGPPWTSATANANKGAGGRAAILRARVRNMLVEATPEACDMVVNIMRNSADHKTRLAAAIEIMNRTMGKPEQTYAFISKTEGLTQKTVLKPEELSDEALATIVALGTSAVVVQQPESRKVLEAEIVEGPEHDD